MQITAQTLLSLTENSTLPIQFQYNGEKWLINSVFWDSHFTIQNKKGETAQIEKNDFIESLFKNLLSRRASIKSDEKRATFDKGLWHFFWREMCVVFTDLSGFTEQTRQFGILHFMQKISQSESIILPIVQKFNGSVVKKEGDSLLLTFNDVEDAIIALVNTQKSLQEFNGKVEDSQKILLWLWIGHGKILKIGDSDVFGDEVNLASKLGEDTAGPWEILITSSVFGRLKKKYGFEPQKQHKIGGHPISIDHFKTYTGAPEYLTNAFSIIY